MNEIGYERWIIAIIIVCSVIALTGCSGVQMEVDKSPGPQQLAGYNLTIGEPTSGEVFDGMYIKSSSAEGGTVILKVEKQPEGLTSVRVIRTQKNDTQMNERWGGNKMNSETDYSFGLETPIYPWTDKYRYRVEALNESDAIIDAVNVTIVDT